jgi:hypothetical protein
VGENIDTIQKITRALLYAVRRMVWRWIQRKLSILWHVKSLVALL